MVKKGTTPKWLPSTLNTIRTLTGLKKILFTQKATLEIATLELGLDFEDVCEVLLALKPHDFHERIVSRITQEWLYIFKPELGGTIIYVKLLLRSECVVISFHEDEDEI